MQLTDILQPAMFDDFLNRLMAQDQNFDPELMVKLAKVATSPAIHQMAEAIHRCSIVIEPPQSVMVLTLINLYLQEVMPPTAHA